MDSSLVKMVHNDLEADILYIVTKEGPVDDTILADDDVYIELDGNGDALESKYGEPPQT